MNKKIFSLFFILSIVFSVQKTFAETIPVSFAIVKSAAVFSDTNFFVLTHLSKKEIQKLAGRKLSFKEKLAIKLYKGNPTLFHQYADSTEEKKLEKKALWSKWLGIGSLIGLFIPGVGLLSLPAAIIAIVFGTSTRDKVKDKRNSRQGIAFGIITLGIIVLLVALVVTIVAALAVR